MLSNKEFVMPPYVTFVSIVYGRLLNLIVRNGVDDQLMVATCVETTVAVMYRFFQGWIDRYQLHKEIDRSCNEL